MNRTQPASKAIRAERSASAQIDDDVGRRIRAGEPGLALAVVKSGTVVHAAGYGLADVRTHAGVAPDTIFHLGSGGKQFTGLAISMLAEERKLAVDDPVSRHLPWLAAFGPKVTVRHLLHHTSGIRDLYDEDGIEAMLARCEQPAGPGGILTVAGTGIDPGAIRAFAEAGTNAPMIHAYADLGCPMAAKRAEPGDTFKYINSDYELLGAVIERASGQTYHDFFASRVFGPLEMHDTFSVPGPTVKNDRRATGYDYERGGFVPHRPGKFPDLVGSGSFYTTVTDLCLYDRALATHALISPASMREALTSGETNGGRRIGYGFGWDLETYKSMPAAGHDGQWIGFYSYIRRYLERPLSVFVLSNNPEVNLVGVVEAATDAYR